MRCNAEFYYVWKIPHIGIDTCTTSYVWFYSPWAVGTTLSEVHVLHREPFWFCAICLSYKLE